MNSDALLLSRHDLLTKEFIHFLVHRNPELRTGIQKWINAVHQPTATKQQQLEAFLQIGPPDVLKAAQEDYIKQGKAKHTAASKANTSSSAAVAAMQPGQGGTNSLTPQHISVLIAQQQQQQQQARAALSNPGASSNPLQALLQQQQLQQRMQGGVQLAAPAGAAHAAGRLGTAAGGSGPSQLPAGLPPNILASLTPQQQQQLLLAAAQPQSVAAAARSNPNLLPGTQALAAAAAAAAAAGAAGVRPGLHTGLGAPQLGRPPALSSAAAAAAGADVAHKAQVQQALRQMKPNEPPKVEPPDGHEWLQCLTKEGKPGWFAVPRAQAQALRPAGAGSKRKAEDAPAGQPLAKQGAAGGKRGKGLEDELVAGHGYGQLDVMDDTAVEAEEAAARAAVVVEAGNVQEEYLLNPATTMTLVARAAKSGGVKAVNDAVYPYLSLAAEAFLGQLLNGMVKMRLQREDMGKGYFGMVPAGKTQLDMRARLYHMRDDEKRRASERAAAERDELAKLGASRKKLGEEEKKAALAAKHQRDLEVKKQNVGSTLQMLGIGHRQFGFSKVPNTTGLSKPGATKPELAAAKAAAAAPSPAAADPAAAPAAATAAANAGSAAPSSTAPAAAGAAQAAAGGMKAEPGSGVSTGPGDGSSSSQPAAAAAVAAEPSPLKPMTLQHQLLGASDVTPNVAPFVAGGVVARKAREGEDALRELTLADLVAVLERHPLYCRSSELYTLHTLAALQADAQR